MKALLWAAGLLAAGCWLDARARQREATTAAEPLAPGAADANAGEALATSHAFGAFAGAVPRTPAEADAPLMPAPGEDPPDAPDAIRPGLPDLMRGA